MDGWRLAFFAGIGTFKPFIAYGQSEEVLGHLTVQVRYAEQETPSGVHINLTPIPCDELESHSVEMAINIDFALQHADDVVVEAGILTRDLSLTVPSGCYQISVMSVVDFNADGIGFSTADACPLPIPTRLTLPPQTHTVTRFNISCMK